MKKWLENIRISKKLSTGFLFIAALGLIIGLVGIFNMISMTRSQESTYNNCTMGIVTSDAARNSFQRVRAYVRDIYIYYDTDRDKYCSQVSDLIKDVNTQLDNYSSHVADDNDKQNYDTVKTAFASYQRDVNTMLSNAKAGAPQSEILTDLNGLKNNAATADTAFDQLASYNQTVAANNLASDKASAAVAIIIMAVVILIALIVSILLGKYISSVISDPIQKFAAFGELLARGGIDTSKILTEKDMHMKERKDEIGTLADAFNKIISGTILLSRETETIASGDLTTAVTVRSDDDILGKAIEKLVNDFRELTSGIISSADQVNAGAKQVADSSTTLSQGATEQASSIEELSASIAEVSERIQSNAKDAGQAKELSGSSGEIIKSTLIDMEQASKAMDEISATSKNISKVIKAIDDIAFQTNILALNAAVEAARAGAAGKGFAVVADEVRNLSHKSSEAAKDSTSLIESSIQAVEKGTSLVGKASESFATVATSAAQINDLVDQISTQAQEQATAISQITTGVEQISSVIQMNSATSEEAAAASEELSSQAHFLRENASKFKV